MNSKPGLSSLSPREHQIAEAFAGGESYSQIAERLHLAPTTVRTHLSTIYRKLGVSTKLALHHALAPPSPESRSDLWEGPPPPRPDKPSIAVLAFTNMSGDPEQDYFSDGIADDIITALSRSPWLFIIARNTTFTYKGSNVDVRRVALDLGVRFVLEGSVRRFGDRVRVTARLIDGVTGGHVWSETYDSQHQDVFDLQDEITRNVTASIQTSVHLKTIEDPVERGKRPDLTVWELTMRSWHLLYDFAPDSYVAARGLLERALVIDPESAEAHMVLSLIHHHDSLMGFASDTRATMEAAQTHGRRAIQLDPRNEYAHWAHGICSWENHDVSLAALERAVELNPNCSVARGSLGTVLTLVGRTEEAITQQEIAIRSNPRDPSIFFRFSHLGFANYLAGRYDTAIGWAERAIQHMPRWYYAYFVLGASHMALGNSDRAREAAQAFVKAVPGTGLGALDRLPLRNRVQMDQLRARLRDAGFPQ